MRTVEIASEFPVLPLHQHAIDSVIEVIQALDEEKKVRIRVFKLQSMPMLSMKVDRDEALQFLKTRCSQFRQSYMACLD